MLSHHTLFPKTILIAAIILASAPVQAGPEGEQPEHPAASETEGAATPEPTMPEITVPLLTPPDIVTPPPAEFGPTAPAFRKASKRAPRPRDCADKRPWYCGVTAEDQARALEIYEQGNQFFDDNLFQTAAARYQEALAHWNHPGIHYNLMLALAGLEQPMEAFQASIEALRYGVQALTLEEYHRAVDYQRLLRGQIASLEVTCEESGAVVSVDGKAILKGPGTAHLLVRPGQHEVIARKDGYLTIHRTIVTVSEKPVSLDMRMLPQAKATVPVRRWPAWQPWVMVSAGVSLGVAGGLLEWRADAKNRDLQKLFERFCLDPDGNEGPKGPQCSAREYNSNLESHQTQYTWYRRMGHAGVVTGGVAMLSGLVLVYLNREQRVENPERQQLVRISVIPSLAPDAAGLSVKLSF
jgi:hypothetical protein